jgi:hypothetical protein
VETRGTDELHAVFFKENRTRGRCQQREAGKSGSGRDDKERIVVYLGTCDWDVWSSGG